MLSMFYVNLYLFSTDFYFHGTLCLSDLDNWNSVGLSQLKHLHESKHIYIQPNHPIKHLHAFADS